MLGKIDTRFEWADGFLCMLFYVEYYWTSRKTLDANESLRRFPFRIEFGQVANNLFWSYDNDAKQSHLLPLISCANNKYSPQLSKRKYKHVLSIRFWTLRALTLISIQSNQSAANTTNRFGIVLCIIPQANPDFK